MGAKSKRCVPALSLFSHLLNEANSIRSLLSGTVSVYTLPIANIATLEYSHSSSLVPPLYSHTHSLLTSLSTTSRLLSPSRVTSLSYTSDGLALAVGWERGWSVWSTFGRLGSWATENALREEGAGYGVEGEKGMGFEDHFLAGVRELVSSTSLLTR